MSDYDGLVQLPPVICVEGSLGERVYGLICQSQGNSKAFSELKQEMAKLVERSVEKEVAKLFRPWEKVASCEDEEVMRTPRIEIHNSKWTTWARAVDKGLYSPYEPMFSDEDYVKVKMARPKSTPKPSKAAPFEPLVRPVLGGSDELW